MIFTQHAFWQKKILTEYRAISFLERKEHSNNGLSPSYHVSFTVQILRYKSIWRIKTSFTWIMLLFLCCIFQVSNSPIKTSNKLPSKWQYTSYNWLLLRSPRIIDLVMKSKCQIYIFLYKHCYGLIQHSGPLLEIKPAGFWFRFYNQVN